MRHIKSGYIKIGYSRNVQTRIQELKYAHGDNELLGCIQGARYDESALHLILLPSRVRLQGWGREWFYPTAAVKNWIKLSTVEFPYPDIEVNRPYRAKTNFIPLVRRKYGLPEKQKFPPLIILMADLGLSANTISYWKSGFIEYAREETVQKICSSLGCTVDDLLPPDEECVAGAKQQAEELEPA